MASGFERQALAVDDLDAVDQDLLGRDEALVVLDDVAGDDEVQGLEEAFHREVLFPADEGDAGQPLVQGLEVLDLDLLVGPPLAHLLLEAVVVDHQPGQVGQFPLLQVFPRAGREELQRLAVLADDLVDVRPAVHLFDGLDDLVVDLELDGLVLQQQGLAQCPLRGVLQGGQQVVLVLQEAAVVLGGLDQEGEEDDAQLAVLEGQGEALHEKDVAVLLVDDAQDGIGHAGPVLGQDAHDHGQGQFLFAQLFQLDDHLFLGILIGVQQLHQQRLLPRLGKDLLRTVDHGQVAARSSSARYAAFCWAKMALISENLSAHTGHFYFYTSA